jgi:hypothetical protein
MPMPFPKAQQDTRLNAPNILPTKIGSAACSRWKIKSEHLVGTTKQLAKGSKKASTKHSKTPTLQVLLLYTVSSIKQLRLSHLRYKHPRQSKTYQEIK